MPGFGDLAGGSAKGMGGLAGKGRVMMKGATAPSAGAGMGQLAAGRAGGVGSVTAPGKRPAPGRMPSVRGSRR